MLGGRPAAWTVEEVGESWPLPLSRAHYEHLALSTHNRLAPGLVPRVHHYNETLALIVMELLQPHIIMRRGMIAATPYPAFAGHITTFMAQTLFGTSDLALWDGARAGDAYPAALFAGNPDAHRLAQERYMRALFADTVGFAAAKMIRRILGLAHNIDLEWIADPDRRAACERRALRLARQMMVERHAFAAIGDITGAAAET